MFMGYHRPADESVNQPTRQHRLRNPIRRDLFGDGQTVTRLEGISMFHPPRPSQHSPRFVGMLVSSAKYPHSRFREGKVRKRRTPSANLQYPTHLPEPTYQ